MAQLEPMDVDDINDNKENAFISSNVVRVQDNAELLDSSENHMKLRYSTTPISSPMSKSYTVITDKNSEDANNCNMTQSLNLTVIKSDTTFTSPKSLPLQTIPSEDAADKTINVLKQLDSLISDHGDVNITVSKALEDDENVSLPSSSSATPEAVTPTKEIPKPIGSPILRGIQSVFNMFRASQSPVSLNDDEEHAAEAKSLKDSVVDTENSITASTPLNIHKKSESISSRGSKDRENPVFREKLEKDLEWDETTIIFSKEKFAIHKLLFQQRNAGPLPDSSTVGDISMASVNESYEAMDISCNDLVLNNKTLQGNNVTSTVATDNLQSKEITGSEKDESLFLDCETTLNESQAQKIDKSNRTQDKTMNDTSFISMQSAETVTCTSDMTENLIVSESFVQDNKDINPIADSNIALEKSVETVSQANLSSAKCVQESQEIVIESQINTTTDENTMNLEVTEEAIQCRVNIVDEKVTEATQGSPQIAIESHITKPSNVNNMNPEVTDKVEDKVIQCKVNIADEIFAEANAKSQHDVSCTESGHESYEIESPTDISNVNKIISQETDKTTINDDVVQNQSISNKACNEKMLEFQYHTETESEISKSEVVVYSEPAGLVPTDEIILQTNSSSSMPDADSLENDKSKAVEQTELEEGFSENNNFSVSSQNEPIVLVSENDASQSMEAASLPYLANELNTEESWKEDIVSISQDVPVGPPNHDIKNDADDTAFDVLSFPAVVDIKPDGSLIITTEDKESFTIPTPSEDISMVKDDMLVAEDEQQQDFTIDTATVNNAKNLNEIGDQNISTACITSQKSESVYQDTEMHKLHEASKEEEIMVSESNSPYVSLGPEVAESESLKEDIISSPKLKKNPLESPIITSMGYNFNFDEMNPFATRTRLSISPTKQVSIDKAIKSPVVSQIMESFPKIHEELSNTPPANIFHELDCITAGSKTTMISENEIIKTEISNSQTIANIPAPVKVDLQQPAEQIDQKLEACFVQNDDFNKTVDIQLEDKANTTEGTDNAIDLSETCSDDKDITVREVHTEDEDTAEGSNIESLHDSKDDCFSSFVSVKSDCGIFDDLPPEAKDEAFEPIESAEMFIDAEAFDFLMSQNRSNEVVSSGKESLFLKFDPLFAKRVNSDGVLDILSKVQKRQSTPKKLRQHQSIMDMSNEEKPGSSSENRTFDVQAHDTTLNTRPKPQLGDFDDTLNEHPKPTMIVTPVVPKHNLKTPSRSIRTPSGVHSPAIAVIDRLLSINSPMAYDDTTVIHYSAQQEEADSALIELRDLVAVKEIEVYQLKFEGKELKDRLFTLESLMENLDKEGEKRLKAINALNEQLNEKDKINKSMKNVVEEYEKTIAGLISEIESDKKRNAEEKSQLIRDRDEQTAHLANMEGAFSDLHSKYEKSKQIILSYKANEDAYKKSVEDLEASVIKMEKTYDTLKEHATAQLNHANQELEKINKSHESEVVKLKAMIKRKDLHITSLEENIAQKIKANVELTDICDELISKVG